MAFTSEQRAAHRAKQKLVTQDEVVTQEVSPSGTPVTQEPVVSTPTIYPDPVHRNAVIDALTEHVPGLRRAVNAAELGDGVEFSPAVLDSEDPIVGLSALTARMAITRSGRLIDTHTLTKEQMVEGGIWLGPNPEKSDFKAEKAPKQRR